MRGSWHGEGAPVALLHGQPGSAADWEEVVPHLQGYRLLVPTRGGYEEEEGRGGGFFHNAEALYGLLENDEPITVVGHSWGAGAALAFAQRYPMQTHALCLLAPVGAPSAVTTFDRVIGQPLVGRAWAGVLGTLGARVTPLVSGLSGSHLTPEQEQELRATLAWWAKTGAWHVSAHEQTALVRETPELFAGLDLVTAPVVVGWGNRDQTVTPAMARELIEALPNVEAHELHAGHLMTVEVPEQLAGLIGRAVELGAR